MAAPPLEVSAAELAVLEQLWEHGSATIRQLAEAIYGDTRPPSIGTVQKLLERLERKRCVRRDRKSFAHVFRPRIDRSALIESGLESLAERLCDGSLTPLLVHLVSSRRLTESERAWLRQFVEGEAEAE